MSLKLTVADKQLKALLAKMNKDNKVDLVEYIQLRKQADAVVASNTLLPVRDTMRAICDGTDGLADLFKQLTLELRCLDYGVPDKDPVKNAKKEEEKAGIKKSLEFQLVYLFTAYRMMLDKL